MSPYKSNNANDLARGKRLMEERKKIWKSRASFKKDTKLSDRSLQNWENGLDITCACLFEIHSRGGDIIYILTGERVTLQATGTDDISHCEEQSDVAIHAMLLEQIRELKRDKEELRADKARLTAQLEQSSSYTEEIKLLKEELSRVKSATTSASNRTRTTKSSNKKA